MVRLNSFGPAYLEVHICSTLCYMPTCKYNLSGWQPNINKALKQIPIYPFILPPYVRVIHIRFSSNSIA